MMPGPCREMPEAVLAVLGSRAVTSGDHSGPTPRGAGIRSLLTLTNVATVTSLRRWVEVRPGERNG